ncbi:MAG: hypothetical protein A3B68_03405 [Candidatus Melainabacteria bacterium RIFCSPHIGHO2_02_FULL_34_12]|nr:MAG: hypothetical protein A3B68_03405 [Candidatus Melainabacteria bacterium RIFCSPHIGHO2_02_FULL_34_12]
MKVNKYINLFFVFLVLFSFSSMLPCESAKSKKTKSHTLKEFEEKSLYLKRKIEETRQKEKVAVSRLTVIQKKLYTTQEQLRRNKFKLSSTQNDLELTQEKLTYLKSDYANLREDSAERIRQIYQGQRLRVLEVLLRTPNLTDFLDALYYQKLVVKQDRDLLHRLEEQSKTIESYKDILARQKLKYANIVSDIEFQKRKIAKEHQQQSVLVSKIRTERASYEQAERQLERDSQQLISEINRLVGYEGFAGTVNGSGIFSYPVRGRLTSPFGPRRHPIFKVVSFHSGVDLAAPFGTPIMASDSGRVIFNGWYGGYGKVVIVDHGMNYSTLYAHLSRASAGRGKTIVKGETIGYEGQTGYSTGPHLHFEVRKNGRPQNPLHYLR